MSKNSNKNRISHLDGLRGIAILWVISYHAYSRWFDYTHLFPVTKDMSIFKYGFLGVPLFFMISGFVIFMTLDKSASFLQFIKRRWLRLFPAMLIVSIFIYLTAPFFYERPFGQPSLMSVLPGLTFIDPFILSHITGTAIKPLEGSFWSLYVEFAFYIIMGIIYFLFGRKYCIPALTIMFILFYVSFALQRFGLSKFIKIEEILGFNHYGWFIIGSIMYETINQRNSKINIGIAVLSVFLLIYKMYYKSHGDYILVLYNIAIIALFVASFYSKKIQSVLSIKPLLIVGFASYPLYLIHENILVSSLIKLHKLGINDTVMYLMPIMITAILTLVTYYIAKYIEPPIKKALQQVIKP